MKYASLGISIVLIAVLLIGVGYFVCTERVNPGYVGLVQNKFTGEIKTINKIGLVVVNPFTQKFADYPISTEWLILTKVSTEGSKHDDSIDTPTREGQNVNVDASLSYRVTDPEKLYRKYRGAEIEDVSQRVIRNLLNSNLMAVTGTYSILEVNDHRDEISGKVTERLKKALAEEGIAAETFTLRAVRLPQSVQASFDAKIAAENAIRQAESKRQETEIVNRTKIAQAEADAQAAIAKAKGEAEANRLIQQSLTPELLQMRSIEKLNPNVEVIYTPQGSNVFVPAPGKGQ